MNDLLPLELLGRTLRRWWLLAALMLLGGAAGWVISQFRHPVYEATAVYQVTLDEQQLVDRGLMTADQLPLQFADQNIYLAPAADMFDDPAARASLVADARSQSIQLKESDFNPNAFYLDRRGKQWFVTVRSADPVTAARLADMWMSTVDAALRDAQDHSNHSISLQLQHDSIQKCFAEMDFNQANQCAGTSFTTPTDLAVHLKELETQMATEQQAGHGIDPALSFVIVSQASLPSHPVLYATGTIIAAGSLMGLLAGLVLVQVLQPCRVR
jgi:Chain length determinant protein.